MFPSFSTQLSHVLPDKLKDKLGFPQQAASEASSNASASIPAVPGSMPDIYMPSAGANGQQTPPTGTLSTVQAPHPPTGEKPVMVTGEQILPANPNKPDLLPASAKPVPGANLKPMSVDEMLKRMPKHLQPKKPKFSVDPEEIRFSPVLHEQIHLQRQVFALPWDDKNPLNPFHTGPCIPL